MKLKWYKKKIKILEPEQIKNLSVVSLLSIEDVEELPIPTSLFFFSLFRRVCSFIIILENNIFYVKQIFRPNASFTRSSCLQ